MARRICVAVVTRNRPQMLRELFNSFEAMLCPKDEDISFLIIENSGSKTLDLSVQGFRKILAPNEIYYFNESRIGISAARNYALIHAIEQGYDLLVYADDDERVEKDWLIKLLECRDKFDLDLVGSPVRPTPYRDNLTFMQRIVWSGLQSGSQRSERKCQSKCKYGRQNEIKIATGSWMGKLDFFRQTGLIFDQQLGLTGGEDWNLWAKARGLGAKTGWACDAIVYETVPAPRLTLNYHFRRNRDHNITEFSKQYHEDSSKALKKLPLKILGRALKFVGSVFALPFTGTRGLVSLASALGGLIGILQGCLGFRSFHYERTTGT